MVDEVADPFWAKKPEELLKEVAKRPMWRHHHDLPELSPDREGGPIAELYEAYIRRVDTMYRMIDEGLALMGVKIAHVPVAADLATAEGFLAMRFIQKGLQRMECYEYNPETIERFLMVRALKRRTIDGEVCRRAKLHRLDLSLPDWARQIDKEYELVFCCGIVYHMEDPIRFLRNVYTVTRKGGVVVLESDTPDDAGKEGIVLRDSQLMIEKGTKLPILEMRPSRNALTRMVRHVGFSAITWIEPPVGAECKYLKARTKSVAVIRK